MGLCKNAMRNTPCNTKVTEPVTNPAAFGASFRKSVLTGLFGCVIAKTNGRATRSRRETSAVSKRQARKLEREPKRKLQSSGNDHDWRV